MRKTRARSAGRLQRPVSVPRQLWLHAVGRDVADSLSAPDHALSHILDNTDAVAILIMCRLRAHKYIDLTSCS